MKNLALWAGALALGTSIAAGAAQPQYPAKPVRVIVPYAPGGGVDILGRMISGGLAQTLGMQFIVDNRPGAGTIIGTELATRAPADGYTLLFTNAALAASPALHKKLPYDTLTSLAPVGVVAGSYNVLVVHPSLPVKSVKALVALAKAKPGGLDYASAGAGSAIHLAMELFQSVTHTKLVHVAYKGAAPALTDVLGGQVLMMFATPPSALGYIKTGRLRALGVTSPQRLAVMPDVSTIAESGYPGFEVNNWYGMLAPAKTPAEIVARLNEAINAGLATPEIQQRIAALGAQPIGGTPQQFRETIQKEIAKWKGVLAPIAD
jgi:tripartite-type tricarboxylate transporter receptor subunit TctC